MKMPEPKTTDGPEVLNNFKILVYGEAGWGKTTQAGFLQEKYGKTLILSGEAGLMSLSEKKIPYYQFSTWSAEPDQEDTYSLADLAEHLHSKEFAEQGYKVIMVDSLSEASYLLMKETQEAGIVGWDMWSHVKSQMLAMVKKIRDLPYHVICTSLKTERQNKDGVTEYWPSICNRSTQEDVCGIFDFVFGVAKLPTPWRNEDNTIAKTTTERYVIAGQHEGWKGKTREPSRADRDPRIRDVTRCGNITELLSSLEMSEDDWQKKHKVKLKQTETNLGEVA